MNSLISEIKELTEDRHHCDDAAGLFDLLEQIEELTAGMRKIPDNDGKVLDKYIEEHNMDIVKITHIDDTNKYILHPESSDDIIVDVTNGQAKRTD